MELKQLFTEHPASVGETYWAHMQRAAWFAGKMLLGAGVCLVHAVFPFVFVKTGSGIITELHTAMVTSRRVAPEVTGVTVKRIAAG